MNPSTTWHQASSTEDLLGSVSALSSDFLMRRARAIETCVLLSDVMQFKLYSKVNELYRNANMTEPLLVWGLRENFFHPPPNAPT